MYVVSWENLHSHIVWLILNPRDGQYMYMACTLVLTVSIVVD